MPQTTALSFIDAHHHLWDLSVCQYPWLEAKGVVRFFGDPTPIQKNYLPVDFLSESPQFKPTQSVHIQVGVAENDALNETRWLENLDNIPSAVVAFCDLTSGQLAEDLDAQQIYSKFRGVRQILGRHADEDRKLGADALLANPALVRGLKQLAKRKLSFDLQMIPPQIERVLELLDHVPGLAVALCHCGSPWDQSLEGLRKWRAGIRAIAKRPNTVCKISGLGMFNRKWTAQDLRPIALEVIDTFGPQRVMFGSNFPVDKLYGNYTHLWQTYLDLVADFSASEQSSMFVDTATRFYRI